MADILHKVQMRASPKEVFTALAARAGLRGEKDSLADFRLGDDEPIATIRVQEIEPGARLSLRCTAGPADWIGTDVTFELARCGAEGEETVVRFGHRNWREATDFMGHCSTKWASLLFGLKSRVETPEPDDLYI